MATTQPRPHPPLITQHAVEQWHARAQGPDAHHLDPASAWIDATPIDLPSPWGDAGDEARYHHDCQVVLCRRDVAITTVYDLTGADAHPVVQAAVANQLDDTTLTPPTP